MRVGWKFPGGWKVIKVKKKQDNQSRKYYSDDGEWTALNGGHLFYRLVIFSTLNETMLHVDHGEMGVAEDDHGRVDGDSSGVGPGRDDGRN